MPLRPLFLLLLAMSALTPLQAQPPAPKIRTLIIDGYSNHDWRQTTQLLRAILDQSGKFDVTVSTAPDKPDTIASWHPKFSDYDVVIQTCNDISGGPMWPDPVKKDFAGYVRNGGGVYIFHGAQNAFRGWREYEDITALNWRDKNYGSSIRVGEDGTLIRIPPGQGNDTNHPDRVNGLITTLGDHPIHKDLPKTWLTPSLEVYRYARGPAQNIEVLSYTRDPEGTDLWPVEWTTTYGKGRAYVSTFGHVWPGDTQPPGMRCAAVQTLIPRVLEWLSNRPVDPTVPPDFPTKDSVSIRPEFTLPK